MPPAREILAYFRQDLDRVPPRFACVHNPWPGIHLLIWLHRRRHSRVAMLNAVAVSDSGSILRLSDFNHTWSIPKLLLRDKPASHSLVDWIAASIRDALKNGRLELRSLRPGDLRDASSFQFDRVAHASADAAMQQVYVEACRRSFACWSRIVLRFADANAMDMASRLREEVWLRDDVWPSERGVASTVQAAPSARAQHGFNPSWTSRMLEPAQAMARIAASGADGLRAWSDVERERPWLASQALCDQALLGVILSGRELAPFLERRLGLTPARRRAFEEFLRKAALEPVSSFSGADHPVIGNDAGIMWVAEGHCTPMIAQAFSWLAQEMLAMEDAGFCDIPARTIFLNHVYERVYGSPHAYLNEFHPKTWLGDGGTSPLFGYDWRRRPHPYSLANMARLVAGGGLRLERVPLDWDHVDDLLGLAGDIHSARKWSMAQVVAPRIARAAFEVWKQAGCDNDIPAVTRLMGAVTSRQVAGLKGREWFTVAAAALCDREKFGLLPLFSDLAVPRSLKRLRALSSGFHRSMAARGIMLPSNFKDRWPPLFQEGSMRLEDCPGIHALCLTDQTMLQQEGEAMRHCVGIYAQYCAGGTQHILSVRDQDDSRLSTFHVAASPDTGPGPVRGVKLRLVEHRGYANAVPCAQVQDFVAALLDRLSMADHGGLPLDPSALQPRFDPDNAALTDHDPWADGAIASEDEVLGLFGEPDELRPHMDALAQALLRAPLPWVRNAHLRTPAAKG